MNRVRLIHMKAAEAQPVIEVLESGGYTVDYDDRADVSYRRGKANPPEAIVIDLSRLPAHGREVAIGFRGAKTTRQIPIVFVDGAAEKVAAIRAKLPDAVYTTRPRLLKALVRAVARRMANPIVPQQMMDRYATRTTAQKLGIDANSGVAVIDPPPGYEALIGPVPDGVEFHEDQDKRCAVTLWFVREADEYAAGLRRMRARAATTRLWVVFKKGKAGTITQNVVRETANQFGLVDYKICSVNETWSGMLFALSRGLR